MSPAAQSVHAVPRRECQHNPEQDSFKYNEQDPILIADTVPPIGHDAANAARRRGHVVRQLCPSLVGEDAGEGLEQIGSKILSANVLEGFNELVDPQMGGVDRSLACR